MSTLTLAPPDETLADIVERLGDVPLERIRSLPALGTATPGDLLRLLNGHPKRLCELVDGVLVEKAMGQEESRLAARLIHVLISYLDKHDLGTVTAGDGPITFDEGLVRLPDVAFIPYSAIPENADPSTPMPDWIPALVVEVLSPRNTRREMERKRNDYFEAGVQLVWIVDPRKRTVEAYTSVDECTTLTDADMLDGGTVLPGFSISIVDWFDWAAKVKRKS